jgi:AraC-like DNA-binding protein
MDALAELRALLLRLAKRRRFASSALPRLHLGYATATTTPTPVMQMSTLALVVQGAKRTGLGTRTFDYGAGHLLVTSVSAPITTQVTQASPSEPFLGVGLALDPGVVASLMLQAPAKRSAVRALSTSKASDELLDAFRRYVRLLEAPDDISFLAEATEREIIWRVMQSAQGTALRERAIENSKVTRISRAIDLLQRRFTEPLPVAALAREARMSAATFHRHFRSVTSLSPMQFQKQLRLQEARTRLLSRGEDVSSVSFAVGYQSTSQFSREYRRQFGLPPGEDAARWRRPGRGTPRGVEVR